MSDNKKWFKVWAHILTDINFQNMSLEDKGKWLILGALLCQQGESGMIKIYPPAKVICQLFNCNDYDALKCTFTPLFQSNVKVALQADGAMVLIMKNWHKYQRDDSKDRVRKFRNKKRQNVTHQEERRGEVTPTSTSSALRASPLDAAVATRETPVKNYEEAGDNELCGPPKDLLEKFRKGLK